MSGFSVRAAVKGDEDLILSLMHELAVYEKLTDRFHVTLDVIRRDYLCEQPLLHCELAYEEQTPVGIAAWYWIYASFAAMRGLYLEDLFVKPDYRGKGYGKALLAYLAQKAHIIGAAHMEWEVLPWNQSSIDFYDGIGATRMTDWCVYRLTGDALEALAKP